MKLVDASISIDELKDMAEHLFGEMVKAVVDVRQEIMVVDAELHADQEQWLLQNGSDQKDLWGINLYPFNTQQDMVEFDSMINLKPWSGNRTKGVSDPLIQKKIIEIVEKLIKR